MSLDTAAATAKLRSLTVKFDNKVKATTPFYSRLCTLITSDGADEEYGMLGSVPSVREWLGDRDFKSVRAAKFEILNKEWESSLLIKKTDIRDDRMNLYGPLVENLGTRAARHPDKLLLSDLLPNGDSRECLDGQFFFDTDHAWGDSGTQSNKLPAAAVDVEEVTVDEFKKALSSALQAMLSFRDDSGELVHDDAVLDMDSGMELVVMVPLKYYEVATKSVSAGITINNGETNVPVVIAAPVASPHITGDYFDLYRVDAPLKPYIFQAREPLTRRTKGLEDIEHKDVKFMTAARYNIGYGAWWTAVRSTFA